MSKSLSSLLLIALTAAACSKINQKPAQPSFDLPPDATGEQVREAHKIEMAKRKAARVTSDQDTEVAATSLDAAIKMGERNLDWLKHINSKLTSTQSLSFSSKSTMTGYPIDKPNRYSDKLALARYNQAVKDMPAAMYKVLIKGEAFTDTPPVDLKVYLEWGLKLDKIYQTSARWQMMQTYLPYLAQRRMQDVRGYYFLNIEPDLENKLRNFKTLAAADQARLGEWLVLICFNTEGAQEACENFVKSQTTAGKVWDLYIRYNPRAKRLFNSYFDITSKRSDITWNESVLVYPFRDPQNNPVEVYLKTNIEDEWKWNGWSLTLKFTPDALTHVEFQPGTTPHVNGLAGSTITMDANAPLTEWDVQWTIRHEFGHSLGFPDCYVEFYEPSSKEIVNYQIDTSNLMCSRMGVLQQKHYDELKKAYSVKR